MQAKINGIVSQITPRIVPRGGGSRMSHRPGAQGCVDTQVLAGGQWVIIKSSAPWPRTLIVSAPHSPHLVRLRRRGKPSLRSNETIRSRRVPPSTWSQRVGSVRTRTAPYTSKAAPITRIATADLQPGEPQRNSGEEQHDREEHGDEHVLVGVLGRTLPLIEALIADRFETVRLLGVGQLVLRFQERARERVGVVERIGRQPGVERRKELRPEAPLIERREVSVASGGDFEPTVEVEEVLGAVLRRQRRGLIRQAAGRVRLGVATGLDAAPFGGLVAAPRDAQRRERQHERSNDLKDPLAARYPLAGLGQLMGRMDMDVFSDARRAYGSSRVPSLTTSDGSRSEERALGRR